MKSVLNVLLGLACAVMLYTMLSAPSPEDVEIAWEEGYEDGRVEGYDEGYADGKIDGVYKNWQSNNANAEYLFIEMLHEAKSYSEEESDDMTFWEAMDIVSVYIDGYDPDGYPLPTAREFKKASEVILNYAVFLEWNALQIEEAYE